MQAPQPSIVRILVRILAGLAAGLAPGSSDAAPCFEYGGGIGVLQPGELVFQVSTETLPNNSNERIPFAAIYVGQDDLYVGVQGDPAAAPESGVAACHERSGVAIAQADDTADLTPGNIASNAQYDAAVLDGRLELAALAGVSQPEAIDNVVAGSNAEVELGFREVFDVASGELGMQDLQIDWSLAGSWSQAGCSGGEFHQPPYRELRLKVFSDPPVGSIIEVLDIHFTGDDVLAFDRLDTAQVHPNGIVYVDVWFKVRAYVQRVTVFGDPPEACYGGDSNADFSGPGEGLSIAFHNPTANVAIVPRSGIAYSQTVPEPGRAALVATALAALALLGRRSTRRSRVGLLLAGACVLESGPAHAQTAQDKHHLTATAGNQFHGDTEVDRFDGRAEALWQSGVAGVNPSFFIHEAVADSDSGVLAISSTFSLAGGAGDPIFVAGSNASSASIEESIDPGNVVTGPVIVTARLVWGGSGQLADGSGDTDVGSVSAALEINNCSASFRKSFASSGFGEGDPSESCPSTFYVTGDSEASAGLLVVSQTIAEPAAVPTRFYVTASGAGAAAQITSLEYFDSGQYSASGQLTIEVSGVDFTYSSPTFLTVPEPGGAALAAAAAGALAALARRPR
jgi:hypothetical protein